MDKARKRQGVLRGHLSGKSDDDVVIVAALRTPITKARRGGLKDTPADDLVACVLQGILDKTGKAARRRPPSCLSSCADERSPG